uniref:J domain-containing protein n=1 Tax=viral metagenome TaxID=1070528 RepID=A0A6C0D6M9_9ZZZZ
MTEDLYGVLGVNRSSSDEEIRKAYRKLSLTHHPDKGGEVQQFHKIQKAYETLSDEKKRHMYDTMGVIEGETDENSTGAPDLASMFMNMMGGGGGFGFSFPGMGSMGSMGSGNVSRKRQKAPSKLHEIPVSLHDFYHGKHLKIQFERQKFCIGCKGEGSTNFSNCTPCNGRGVVEQIMSVGPGMHAIARQPCGSCNGNGKTPIGKCDKCNGKKFFSQEKVLDIRIEPGMKSGDNLVFNNECSDDSNYIEPGDVHIAFTEADENLNIERKGNDLHSTCKISFTESLLGIKYILRNHPNHPSGLNITIPKGTLNNEVITIDNEGMPKRNTKLFGNLYLKIEVTVSAKEKQILETHSDEIRKLFT